MFKLLLSNTVKIEGQLFDEDNENKIILNSGKNHSSNLFGYNNLKININLNNCF